MRSQPTGFRNNASTIGHVAHIEIIGGPYPNGEIFLKYVADDFLPIMNQKNIKYEKT